MATYILKRKTFGFPTFGLRNLGNSLKLTQAGQTMTGMQRMGQAAKGLGKMALTGAAVGTAVGVPALAIKTADATKDSFEGDGIHG